MLAIVNCGKSAGQHELLAAVSNKLVAASALKNL